MRDEILEKLEALKDYVSLLEDYQNSSLEEVEEDPTLRGAIERYFSWL